MTFHGKVALVTGGGSGMGQIMARRLASSGARVAVLDLNEEGMKATAEGRDNVDCFRCDVSDYDEVQSVVRKVEESLGPIDRFVHAAAIMPTGPCLEMEPQVITKLMRVNYEGTVHVAHAALPKMKERGRGEFVFFGSLAGHVLAPHLGPYNATKAAVNSFVEVMIHENRGSGVQIMLVCPPMVNTPLIDQATGSSNPGSIRLGLSQGRLASPDSIIDAIEQGLEKKTEVLFPDSEARTLFRLRRFVPRFLWWMIERAEEQGKKVQASTADRDPQEGEGKAAA